MWSGLYINISWILGSGPKWYGKWHSHDIQEQGHNFSVVGVIAFLFDFFKYLFKKLFFRKKFFLKSIYFSSCKISENLESASLMVPNKDMPYTDYNMTHCIQKVFIATYICIWSTMYTDNNNDMLSMTREGPYLILRNKGKLVAWTLLCFYVLKITNPLLYDDDTLTHAANDITMTFMIVVSKILDGRSWSYLDIELFTICTLKRFTYYT